MDGYEDNAMFEKFIGGHTDTDPDSSILTDDDLEDYYCNRVGTEPVNEYLANPLECQ